MSEQFNGCVRVKDGNKAPQEYGVNREVEVTISFSTDDAGKLDATARLAASVADNIVNEKLQRTPATAGAVVVEPAKGKPGRKAAEKLPAPPAADPAAIVETKVAAADPAAVVVETQAIQTGGERTDPAAMGAPAAANDDVFTSAPPAAEVINDNHLMSAITRKNAETKNPLAIRGLISKYVPQDGKPHQAAEIEQGKRQAFLLELDKIVKAAA